MWVFGYGSLIWKPSFPYRERRTARIDGWMRRFWQGSTDHRGVPGSPGRVVTLIQKPGESCCGVAFHCDDSAGRQVLESLDYREKGGYRRENILMHFTDGSSTDGFVYVAGRDNPDYLGPADANEIAGQIRSAAGPSGSNVEYVRKLAAALRTIGARDAHVFEVEARLDM